MEQRNQLDREILSCSICLDLLTDPVTIPCGHSYCMNCIKSHWDQVDQRRNYSCPQCRETKRRRPFLKKNTMLAALVEPLKRTEPQAAPADLSCYAGPEDVACDFCIGRKLKATVSCLFCVASYCKKHLQPHHDVPPLKKHKLMEPSKNLQEYICSDHDEMVKMFCRTDQKCICYICPLYTHKGHDTVSAAEERMEREKELDLRLSELDERILDRKKDVKLLQKELKVINRSADKTIEDSEEIFTQLLRLIQKRCSDVKQQIRSQQETEVSRVKELQEKLEQEITELERTFTELMLLSVTEDHCEFLFNCPSVSALRESPPSSSINIRPVRYFEGVTAALSELRDQLQNIQRDNWTNVLQALTEVEVLLTEPEPKSRAEFLKYSCEITLDPNTANTWLILSEENRKVTYMKQHLSYPDHPDRFTSWCQVLSREGLTGRGYWEVEWSGRGVSVAVAYKKISRLGFGNECGFGYNKESWALDCNQNINTFLYNDIRTSISGPVSSRVGVYLDHKAGILSFYSVSETMTLLHRVRTIFTQPLYAGVCICNTGDSANLSK